MQLCTDLLLLLDLLRFFLDLSFFFFFFFEELELLLLLLLLDLLLPPSSFFLASLMIELPFCFIDDEEDDEESELLLPSLFDPFIHLAAAPKPPLGLSIFKVHTPSVPSRCARCALYFCHC